MKIIVFDDDPTGSQTVHGCPLLLKWDSQILKKALTNNSPLVFLLANTRAMSPLLAEETLRTICKALLQIFQEEDFSIQDFLIVSRGDSTLRGHGVLEPDILNEILGPFDATFHVPAFFEGGRTTVNGLHLLNGLPVHQTVFAKDRIFGYSTSHLADWLEEKSGGKIMSKDVLHLNIELLDEAAKSELGISNLIRWLLELESNRMVIVDAAIPQHLNSFAQAIRILIRKKKFLFRSSASLISSLANLPLNQYTKKDLISLRVVNQLGESKPGLISVGSHVKLADQQLVKLLTNSQCQGVEIPVKKISDILEDQRGHDQLSVLHRELMDESIKILDAKITPVFYTSRGEYFFPTAQERITFGLKLAGFMAQLIVDLIPRIGYIISKGGVSTHILLSKGMNLDFVNLKGQLLPGLSVVCPDSKTRIGELPILTFPGNLGDENTLGLAWETMETKF